MKGSTYKRCKCRDADGKELGANCPKLRRRDGSWNPRHGSWYFGLELEAGAHGARRKVRRGGFESSDAAEEALEAAKALAARGGDPQNELKVGPYLDQWLAAHKGIRATTAKSYREHIENYLKPHLGHIELTRLRVSHLGDMFDAIDQQNLLTLEANEERRRIRGELKRVAKALTVARKSADLAERQQLLAELAMLPAHRRPPGPATKQRIRATLRSALTDALAEQSLGLTVNVARLIRMEPARRPKALLWNEERVKAWFSELEGKAEGRSDWGRFLVWRGLDRPSDVMIWSPQQTGVFLDAIVEHRLYALYHLIAFRGLRRGEACGLGEADVNLRARELSVREQLVRVAYSDIRASEPKTDASDDTIPLDHETTKVLRTYKAAKAAAKLEWGESWVASGRFFTQENGEDLHPDTVYEEFMRLAYKAGLPPIRLHDLRHGAATLMLAGGADMKVVQALLRHSSMQVTSDTYTSVLPDVARAAAEAAAALVPRRAQKARS